MVKKKKSKDVQTYEPYSGNVRFETTSNGDLEYVVTIDDPPIWPVALRFFLRWNLYITVICSLILWGVFNAVWLPLLFFSGLWLVISSIASLIITFLIVILASKI